MSAQSEMLAALESGDARRCAAINAEINPHYPAPESTEAAEAAMHIARTQIEAVSERKRCYSHAWLVERRLPSQLPDRLKAKADRLYPRVVEAVFVGVLRKSSPIAGEVQAAMSDAVEDCYANGDRNPELVRARMFQARKRTFRQLLGVR